MGRRCSVFLPDALSGSASCTLTPSSSRTHSHIAALSGCHIHIEEREIHQRKYTPSLDRHLFKVPVLDPPQSNVHAIIFFIFCFLFQIVSSSAHTKRTKKYKAPSTASAIDRLDVKSSFSTSSQGDPTAVPVYDNQGRGDIDVDSSNSSKKRSFETALRHDRRKLGLVSVVDEDLQVDRVPSALTPNNRKYSSASKFASLFPSRVCGWGRACRVQILLQYAERTNDLCSSYHHHHHHHLTFICCLQ